MRKWSYSKEYPQTSAPMALTLPDSLRSTNVDVVKIDY